MVSFKDLRDDSAAELDLGKAVQRLRLEVQLAEAGYLPPTPDEGELGALR